MKNISLLLVILLSTQWLHVHSQNLNGKELNPKIDALVHAYTELDIFSGVIMVADQGNPVYHKAFGMANREKAIPNTLQTKFDIGSMNKSFTKVVIMKLVEKGMLKLEDNLGKFIAGFSQEAAENITVEHLLNHTSGVGEYFYPGYFEFSKEEKSISSLIKRIQQKPLLFPPGEEQEYSNSGYVVLGGIIEAVTGKTYIENIRTMITEPLGLTETVLWDIEKIQNRAIGYFKNYKGELNNNSGFMEIPKPDGGFQSTTKDILKFYQAYFYGEELWSDELKKMDAIYPYLEKFKRNGKPMAYAGGYEGANTVYFELLKDKISVIVFANMDEPVAEQLGAGILEIITGKEPNAPSLPAVQNVYKAYQEKGIDYVKKNFESLTVNFHPTDPRSWILNMLGYQLMSDKSTKDALAFFQLNTELFPKEANTWDSLAECYVRLDDKANAKKYYQKALKIDPELPSALKMMKELE